MEEHDDDRIILVNHPLSFAIACNFYDSEEAREDGEFMSCVTPSSASSDCCMAYADRESPQELICEFVRILHAMARVRRRIMLSRYSCIIEHVTAWFKEKYIEVDLGTRVESRERI